MIATAIIIATLCIILAAGYAVSLHFTKEPQLTDEQQAEMSVVHEWWNANQEGRKPLLK